MPQHDLLKLADRYRTAKIAYNVEMDKRAGVTLAATKEEVSARLAMEEAEADLLAAARSKYRDDEPIMLPDLRLGRAEKLMTEEALARTGSLRLAAQLLDVTTRKLRRIMINHQIEWPKPTKA